MSVDAILSGLPAVVLLLLGLVLFVILCFSIVAIRRDHPHHVHTLWYVFSLTFCSVSLLFFYIYKNARTIGATPLGDEHIRENIAVFFMNSSTEVREEVYILAAIGSLLIVPQLLSYFVNGLFGCGSPPIFVSAVARAE